MGFKELLRRYTVFTISIFIIALGISIVVRSDLGTSPISSVPYVFSINTPITMGSYLFILCLLFIVLQMFMLGKQGIKEKKMVLLTQIPISFIFGLCADLSMWALSDFNPESYVSRLIFLVIGCFILALGISLEVTADALMMGGEYTVQIAAKRFKKEFGVIKIMFDVTLVILAVISSLCFSHQVEGIREGTIIVALLTGPFVKMIMPYLNFVQKWQTFSQNTENDAPIINNHILITISREYGSGGHDIGKMLSNKLGIPFYDKKLIDMVAEEGGFSKDFVEDKEQNIRNSLLYNMILQDYEAPLEKSLSPEDALFVAQSKVIKRIAESGSCIIVGRCSNFILDKYTNNINIFLHADMDYKVKRITSQYGIRPDKAQEEIKRIDKARKDHYNYYTGKNWGDARNYQLTCNSSVLSQEDICDAIEKIYKKELTKI